MIKLFLDVDEVVTKSKKQICKYYNYHYKDSVNWKEVKEWDFSDQLPLINVDEIEEWFASISFYDTIKMYKDAKKYINKLSKRYEVYFCTMGTIDNLKNKSDFLKENFPSIPILTLGIDCSKNLINMKDSIFVDDKLQNLQDSYAHIKILFEGDGIEMNYNSKWYGYKAYHWKDLYETIESINCELI